ncbi:Serine/threonine protein kinase [Georgfuchsia toluolica]|uniref:Serine/threonine protein kinase n=1 Tax=Georgfuchsia toluolica TaxID=424218 RepID=A0A916J7G6_9PROT|nr:Serine/threonine protein kinase [Georgfuchsia toluolica]
MPRLYTAAASTENPGIVLESQVSSVNQPLPAGFRIGQYRIERRISDGGFSIVYLAYDEQEAPVAIKEYLPAAFARRTGAAPEPVVATEHRAAFDQGRRCFFEEAQHLVQLKHKNVVRVLDFLRANGTVYLVMEYERGRTLQEHIHKLHGTLGENFLRYTFAHLLSGLREVHTQKLLHLDIKPANIYLRSDGTPVLLDFGASRQTLGRDTPPERAMHTPGFAAPEQYGDDEPLGPWTDIYAVGATMYACLSGAKLPAADERRKKDQLRPATAAWRGKYSAHLLGLIDGCLALDPLARPQSIFALQRELATPPPHWLHHIGSRLRQAVKK